MSQYTSLLEGVLQAGTLYPNNKAIQVQNAALTYAELIGQAKTVAHALLSLTNSPKLAKIGIFGRRSLSCYVGTLASLMTGAAFVPLNPRFPELKIKNILLHCKPDAILVEKAFYPILVQHLAEMQLSFVILCIDDCIKNNDMFFQLH